MAKKAIKTPAKREKSAVPKFLVPGKNYILRAVTYHTIGTFVDRDGNMAFFKPATWLADSTRYSEMLLNGAVNESEPYPDGAWVNLDTVVDAAAWSHPIPGKK